MAMGTRLPGRTLGCVGRGWAIGFALSALACGGGRSGVDRPAGLDAVDAQADDGAGKGRIDTARAVDATDGVGANDVVGATDAVDAVDLVDAVDRAASDARDLAEPESGDGATPQDATDARDSTSGDGGGADRDAGRDALPDGMTGEPYQVCGGPFHSCAWKTQGPIYCWGTNYGGELGAGHQFQTLAPLQVLHLQSVKQVRTGGSGPPSAGHSCAIDVNDSLWCWGWNSEGQLGVGDFVNRSTPTQVPGLSGVVDVRLGDKHTCALDGGGAIWCWGAFDSGQLGAREPGPVESPARLITPHDAVELAVGNWHGCLRTAAGEIRCWGRNAWGEVGSGDGQTHDTPIVVAGTSGALQVSAGSTFSCAMTAARKAVCWGQSYYTDGPLGDSNVLLPHGIVGLPVDLASLAQETPCALNAGGNVWCWGPLPPVVDINARDARMWQGFNDVASLSGSCGATHGGDVRCFGFNGEGQLGDGTGVDSALPVRVLLPR